MLLQSAGRWRHLQTSATYFRPIGSMKWGRPRLCKIGPRCVAPRRSPSCRTGPAVPVIGRVRRHRQRLVNTPPRPDQTQSTWIVSTFVDDVDSTPRPLHAYLAMPDAASPAPGRMGLRSCPAGPYHREVAAFSHSPSGHGFVTYCCAMLWKLCYVVHVMHVLHAATWSRQMQSCMPPGICGQLEPSTP